MGRSPQKEKSQEKERFFTKMEKYMKVSLLIMKNMEKAISYWLMARIIRDNSNMGQKTEREDFNGLMDRFMMGNGKTT